MKGGFQGGRSGILLVDKPPGPTSHDIVVMARRELGRGRVGHTGTLDPFASGLLVLCVGSATRLAEYLVGLDKVYVATLRLGAVTDTDDRTGRVVAESDAWMSLTDSAIEEAIEPFRGGYEQKPPRYSAKKIEGERAHRLARRGAAVELEARFVRIDEITVIEADLPLLTLEMRCSSGTYVRSLARDLGDALSVGAHLAELRRTCVGEFSVGDAIPPEQLGDPSSVAGAWITPVVALSHLPRIAMGPADAEELRHGRPVVFAEGTALPGPAEGPVASTCDGALVAVGRWDGRVFRPRKVFGS
jgi:tRNA pseudouridine55 synthase